MRYSTEAKFRKYVEGYGFCHLQENLVINMVKKLVDAATKTEIYSTKTASKRVVKKTAEATGDLIGNKIAGKITSMGKSKEKEKTKKAEEMYIPPKKTQQIIEDLKEFWP